MRLAAQWEELRNGWSEARIRVTLEELANDDRAAQLLGPLQAYRAEPGVLTFRAARGDGDAVRRLLERLDGELIHGSLDLTGSDPEVERADMAPPAALSVLWDSALATLPADWSDLLAEVELSSSDYVDRAAVNMTPINPRRVTGLLVFRFRSARKFGYGASPGMVRRCFERCDADDIRGSVRILRVLSDTKNVQTQGPVWQLDGRTV